VWDELGKFGLATSLSSWDSNSSIPAGVTVDLTRFEDLLRIPTCLARRTINLSLVSQNYTYTPRGSQFNLLPPYYVL
jgi:hypothetical protein